MLNEFLQISSSAVSSCASGQCLQKTQKSGADPGVRLLWEGKGRSDYSGRGVMCVDGTTVHCGKLLWERGESSSREGGRLCPEKCYFFFFNKHKG